MAISGDKVGIMMTCFLLTMDIWKYNNKLVCFHMFMVISNKIGSHCQNNASFLQNQWICQLMSTHIINLPNLCWSIDLLFWLYVCHSTGHVTEWKFMTHKPNFCLSGIYMAHLYQRIKDIRSPSSHYECRNWRYMSFYSFRASDMGYYLFRW